MLALPSLTPAALGLVGFHTWAKLAKKLQWEQGKQTDSSAAAARALLSAASLGDSTSGTAQRTEPESLVLERHVCSTSIDMEVTVPVAVFQTHNLRHSTVQLHV